MLRILWILYYHSARLYMIQVIIQVSLHLVYTLVVEIMSYLVRASVFRIK